MEPVAASAARIGGVSLLRLQSDETLARLAATGSDEAFEALVRRYRRTLLRSCRRLLSEDRAEDAVQQALLDAHQALARNGSPERFRPWLHRISVNAALKIARESRDVAPIPVDEGKTNGGESPEQTHERRDRLRRTVSAIDALPRRQRRALVLRELEGRSHDEIARELGLSGGAVRQLIHRARQSVRSAASALIPPGFVLRLLGASGGGPVEEIAAGGAGGAVAAKVTVAALLTGGVAGGIALEHPGGDRPSSAGAAQTRESPSDTGAPRLSGVVTAGALAASGSSVRSGSDSGPGGGEGGSSGPGSGSSDDNSGSGSSDEGSGSSGDQGSGSSGSGSEDNLVSSGSDSSGSGSGGSPSSGSGSSGSGSELSVESSGSGSSGSIDSESSGSGSYASDSSGTGSTSETSDTSGSGSSGSGSGED